GTVPGPGPVSQGRAALGQGAGSPPPRPGGGAPRHAALLEPSGEAVRGSAPVPQRRAALGQGAGSQPPRPGGGAPRHAHLHDQAGHFVLVRQQTGSLGPSVRGGTEEEASQVRAGSSGHPAHNGQSGSQLPGCRTPARRDRLTGTGVANGPETTWSA